MPVKNLTPPSVESTKGLYSELHGARDKADPWHEYTHLQAELFVSTVLERHAPSPEAIILNAGSAGNALGISSRFHVHLDLSETLLKGTASALAADVHCLPFKDEVFSTVICIGAVLNYCDLTRALGELSRVLKPAGLLIIEFERSQSWEFLFTPTFRRNAAVVQTFYNGIDHPLWVYSDAHVRSVLKAHGLDVQTRHYYHMLSPLILRITGSLTKSRFVASLDRYIHGAPILKSMACNTIWSCSKKVAAS